MPIQNVTNSPINNVSNNVNSVKPNEQTKKQEIEPKKINKKKLACTLAAALGVTALAAAIIFKGKSKGKIEEVITSEAAKLEEAVVPEMEKAQRAFSPEILKLSDEALLDIPKIEKEAQEILTEAEEVQQKGQNVLTEMLEKIKGLSQKPKKTSPFVEDGKTVLYDEFGRLCIFDKKENVAYFTNKNGVLSNVSVGRRNQDFQGTQGLFIDKEFIFLDGKMSEFTRDIKDVDPGATYSKKYHFIRDKIFTYDENVKLNYETDISSSDKCVHFDNGKINYKMSPKKGEDNLFNHELSFDKDKKLIGYSGILEK